MNTEALLLGEIGVPVSSGHSMFVTQTTHNTGLCVLLFKDTCFIYGVDSVTLWNSQPTVLNSGLNEAYLIYVFSP